MYIVDDNANPTTNMKLLITANILKNKLENVLNQITKLKTGNENFGEYLQKRIVFLDHYNCKCR